MAKTLYFNGDIELKNVCSNFQDSGVAGRMIGSPLDFAPVYVAGKGWDRGYVAVTRTVNYKSNPSLHECDARCMNASGRTMNCECSCRGKNHGRGSFKCSEAA